jgi:hypothetical protein
MSDEIIRRATRAACQREYPSTYACCEECETMEVIVRAVILSLREPTEAMCDAPADAGNAARAKAVWQSMIDEALR